MSSFVIKKVLNDNTPKKGEKMDREKKIDKERRPKNKIHYFWETF